MGIADSVVHNEAKEMALAVNGGDWDKDYTDAQKKGWEQKALWAMLRYSGIAINPPA